MLQGKVALITGVGAGIGAATTARFAAEGATLWLNDLDPGALAASIDAARTAGAEADGGAGDVSDSGYIDAWVAGAVERHGRIDVLYNNVGVSRMGLLADLTDEDWHYQFRVTLDSVFFATRAVLPHMVAAGKGSIISMSSGAGIGGQYNIGGYAAAKAGVVNLMETVASEYGRHGIRANSVTPGPTATAPLLAYLESRPGGVAGHVAGRNLARLTEPEEVAAIVTWLASDDSSSVSGICLRSNTVSASVRPPA